MASRVPVHLDFAKKLKVIHFGNDGSNNVLSSMFDCSKPKIGCLSSIPNEKQNQIRSMFEKIMVNSVR